MAELKGAVRTPMLAICIWAMQLVKLSTGSCPNEAANGITEGLHRYSGQFFLILSTPAEAVFANISPRNKRTTRTPWVISDDFMLVNRVIIFLDLPMRLKCV
tara:strand:+ start:131 stop:436 length:306 start_codon:yes stop_codon:yes gene_type:complete